MERTSPLTAAIASEVRVEMARRRIKGTDLAAKAGLTQSAMSRRTTGVKDFTLPELAAVCDALGVSPADLISRAQSTGSAWTLSIPASEQALHRLLVAA